MACNVFGTPVTDETLKGMPEYHDKALIQRDRARVALELKNAEDKDVHARKYGDYVHALFGDGKIVTMVFIYNATGGPLTYVDSNDWEGRLCHSPYPLIIANGQWGVFVHGKWDGSYSKGAVVYSGKGSSEQTDHEHWILAWANNAVMSDDNNRVYTEVVEPSYIYDKSSWNKLEAKLDSKRPKRLVHQTTDYRGVMLGSMGDDKICSVEAIMTLPDALPK